MIDDKKLKEAEARAKQYLRSGAIKTNGSKAFVGFFTKNSTETLEVANALYTLSTNEEKQKIIGLTNFNGFLWVVNASYYSMFYMARALLENSGIQIKSEQSIHAITFDAVIYFFYITGKLKKNLIEHFIEANEEAAELLGQEKANQLISDYFNEKGKRGTFTYEMGALVMKNKAKTSLERANNFNKEINRILGN